MANSNFGLIFIFIIGIIMIFYLINKPILQTQEFTCTTADKVQTSICTTDYTPVCAKVQVQCFTTPCNPIQTTFSNACQACHNQNVISYIQGQC